MAQHAAIRSDGLFGGMRRDPFHHSPLRRVAQNAVVGEMDPAKKIGARGKRFDENLIGMELQLQPAFQKIFHFSENDFKPIAIRGKDDKIVSITDILFCAQMMFCKLVDFVHIDIHEKLGCQIAERQTVAWLAGKKLSIIFWSNPPIFLSGIYSARIPIKTIWSIFAKNFFMSHFNTQQV